MKPTWIIHFIPCGKASYHTHGLNEYGSLEVELALPLESRQAAKFINLIANEIAEKGRRYQSGDSDCDVFNVPFYLFQTRPVRPSRPDDQVLRILFCDPTGKYPWESGCQEPYASQLCKAEKKAMAKLLLTRKEDAHHE